ncbi:MAG TPA: MCM family protein [Euryarchaeota archaeon]|nr:MCM family protein [Euryarchaeota archaeon]
MEEGENFQLADGPENGGSTAEIVAKFEQFFRVMYKKELSDFTLTHPNATSIVVDFRKLEAFDYKLADALLDNPKIYLDAMETALSRVEVAGLEPGTRLRVRLANIPPDRNLLVRDIRAEYIGKIVGTEGLVRQITTVMPKLKVARWACRHCGKTYDILQEGSKLKRPVVCVCGKKDFELLADESVWIDFQKIQIQEPIEHLRGGEQARFIDVHLEGDLVNKVKPGDRVDVVGILELLQQDGRKTVYGKYIQALNIEPVQKEFEELEPTPEEVKKIKELARDPEIYEKLVKSIAPTIWGHEKIKEAIALQLFGGVKKEYSGGTHIRGNIHVLLLGDPSTGKSQMLRYAARIAPKSIYVAGKTASGAGLTASAEKDELGEGGWVIKAGALVLASGGIAAVDEFEKIDAKDRAALHEAMEQQSYEYDFEILLANGKKVKIGELVDRLMEVHRNRVVKGKETEILPDPGIEVVGYNLKDFKPVRIRADRVSRHLAPREVVEIEFSNGRTVRVTPEHPVMLWRNGGVVEVQASDVRAGDLALAVRSYPVNDGDVDPRLARFMGFLLPGGRIYRDENGANVIEFATEDEDTAREFRALVEEMGESYDIEISEERKRGRGLIFRIVSGGLYNRITWEFHDAFHGNGNGLAVPQRVPQKILGAKNGAKKEFISAYYRVRGTVSALRAGFTVESREMGEDLQDVLYCLGIHSQLTRKGNKYFVAVQGAESLEKLAEIIKNDKRSERVLLLARKARRAGDYRDPIPQDVVKEVREMVEVIEKISGEESRIKSRLRKAAGASREDIAACLDWVEERLGLLEDDSHVREKIGRIRGVIEGNARFLTVCRVEKKRYGEKWVYDVTVEPHHLFVSHGLVLHNTVSVAKAGIVTTFKADTAILAAANPKFGRFDPYENPILQINLEPTLLSRFDLIFIVKEVLDVERDRKIARHILQTHLAGEKRIAYMKGVDSSLTAEEVEEAEKHVKPEIDIDLLRKYIAYARTHVFPQLTEEAMKKIEDFYVNLRQLGKKSGTVPTTARQLEALIRLAEASARVRLSNLVTEEDAERAIRLAQASMEEILKDKETGVFDYDIITTGESKSKREKMKIVLNIIRTYTAEHDSMPVEDLVEEAKTYGIEEQDVYDIIEKLKKNGEIYEPRPGVLRLAG